MRIETIKLVLVLSFLSLGLLWTAAARGQQNPVKDPPPNYEKFTHKSHLGQVKVPATNHARELKCDSCHERTEIKDGIITNTERNKQLSLKFPSHKACIECHVVQFTGRPQQTCTICHDTSEGLIARPPQRDFPQRYDYNAFFDARQHELHVTYNLPNSGKKLDCNFCHKQDSRPAILTIPSHSECYVCHSPKSGEPKASQKWDCKNCHTETVTSVQPYSAKYVSRAYGARFTHKAHVELMGGRCDMCHTISGGYNQPRPTSIRVKEHLTPAERGGRGCFSCHDGGRHYGYTIFSGEPGNEGGGSCMRCHKRNDFKVFPSTG
jgi:hypothetical protein